MKSSSGVINNCKWEVVNCDCREYMREMVKNNIEVDCIITSPPYFNRRSYGAKPKVDGNIAKWLYASSGKPIENEIGNSDDENKYIEDIGEVFDLCYKVLKDNKHMFINIANTHKEFELLDFSREFIDKAKEAGFIHWDTIIWIKNNPVPAGRHKNYYLAQGWEYILAFTKGKRVNINTSNVSIKIPFICEYCKKENYLNTKITPNYLYSYVGCYGRTQDKIINHPAVYPIEIPNYCIDISSHRGDLIFDPFVGSGTTLIAGLTKEMNVMGCELVSQIYDDLVKKMNEVKLK